MKQVLIILENDVLNEGFYLGKSGDFCVVDYFLRHSFEVFTCGVEDVKNNLENLKIFKVQNQDYANNYYKAIWNECGNMKNQKSPGFGKTNEMCVKLELHESELGEIKNGALLFSRAMPQSLTEKFLVNFKILSNKLQALQNMEAIVLLKDKVIPFLLQENKEKIDDLAKVYNDEILKFKNQVKGNYESLVVDSIITDLDENFEKNYEKIEQFAKFEICIKPFNLFGGVGVGIFKKIDKDVVKKHLDKIKEQFVEYGVNERHLVVVQKAVKHPAFGDIRAIFAYGKFIGAFKRWEQKNMIHNTMNGAVILPVCDENFKFSQEFEKQYHNSFIKAIKKIAQLSQDLEFLQNEPFYGCDLLLDEVGGGFQFKLTEINIACPTGLSFLEQSLIFTHFQWHSIAGIKKYYNLNGRIIDKCLKYSNCLHYQQDNIFLDNFNNKNKMTLQLEMAGVAQLVEH